MAADHARRAPIICVGCEGKAPVDHACKGPVVICEC